MRIPFLSQSAEIRFEVLCRLDAERYRGDAPYAVISFGDPYQSMPTFTDDPLRVAICRIQCEDEDFPAAEDTFTDAQAQEIIAFMEALPKAVRFVVVHCEAGISRSRGCAVALGTIYGDSTSHSTRGGPNVLIVRRLINAYNALDKHEIPTPVIMRDSYACAEHPDALLASSDDQPLAACSVCGGSASPMQLDRVAAHIVQHPNI